MRAGVAVESVEWAAIAVDHGYADGAAAADGTASPGAQVSTAIREKAGDGVHGGGQQVCPGLRRSRSTTQKHESPPGRRRDERYKGHWTGCAAG